MHIKTTLRYYYTLKIEKDQLNSVDKDIKRLELSYVLIHAHTITLEIYLSLSTKIYHWLLRNLKILLLRLCPRECIHMDAGTHVEECSFLHYFIGSKLEITQ